ncbi:DNA recombination/repair protein RecA, partial [Candidatus Bipolaricaulota bacterium]|nr:DNA recombination/repair protein RecA [Candidatus Bipolaricaulota bacterium]
GEALGLVTRSGSWYSFGDERLGQGIGNSALALEENPKLADELELAIRTKVGWVNGSKIQESADVQEPEATESAEE